VSVVPVVSVSNLSTGVHLAESTSAFAVGGGSRAVGLRVSLNKLTREGWPTRVGEVVDDCHPRSLENTSPAQGEARGEPKVGRGVLSRLVRCGVRRVRHLYRGAGSFGLLHEAAARADGSPPWATLRPGGAGSRGGRPDGDPPSPCPPAGGGRCRGAARLIPKCPVASKLR